MPASDHPGRRLLEALGRPFPAEGLFDVVPDIVFFIKDAEGRYLELQLGSLNVVSLYLPSGSSGDERQQVKFRIMDWLMPLLRDMAASGHRSTLTPPAMSVRYSPSLRLWQARCPAHDDQHPQHPFVRGRLLHQLRLRAAFQGTESVRRILYRPAGTQPSLSRYPGGASFR